MSRLDPSKYDFSKLDFELMRLDKHYTPLAKFDKRYFVVHHMTIVGTGNGDACVKCYNVWQNRQASAHYSVDGKYVCQHVYDKDFAWATGSNAGNLYGISVEFANKTAGPGWTVDEETIRTGAKLIANGHVLYKFGRPVDGKTLFQHDQFTSTACPGPYLGGTEWKRFVALVQRYYDEITGATTPVEPPPPVVRTAVWGKPETWILGAVGPDVLKLGERIVVWSKVLGLPSPYKVGPGEPYGPADVAGLQNLQKAWGFGSAPADLALGGASDGYPGLKSFEKLASNPTTTPTPTPEEPVAKVSAIHWNIAGSDDVNGYGSWNSTRGIPLGKHVASLGFDVFLACEAGQYDLRKGVSTALGITSWMERSKAIWYRKENVRRIYACKAYSDHIYIYLGKKKWGGAFFGEEDGKKFSLLEVHLDHRSPAKQRKQLQVIFKKWLADCQARGIKRANMAIGGDFNWDGSSTDNPFKALVDWGFIEAGDPRVATFWDGRHLDGWLVHKTAKATCKRKSRENSAGKKLSDHYPLKLELELQ